MPFYPPRRPKGKKLFESLHSIRRARLRYALELTLDDVAALSRMVRRSETTIIRRTSNARTVHRATYKGKEVTFVYDKVRKTIITFLPPRSKGRTAP